MSVFHPANVTSDGWEAPQTPQSHSPATNSCATDLIPRPSVPKSQVEVGWGCILSCMRTCCIGCILYTYSRLSSSRLACHAIQRIQRIQPYSHTRHTSYSAIQPPSGLGPLGRRPGSGGFQQTLTRLVGTPTVHWSYKSLKRGQHANPTHVSRNPSGSASGWVRGATRVETNSYQAYQPRCGGVLEW